MSASVADWLVDPALWKNATIPFVAAFVGWFTNWVAIEMTFKPLEFRGVRPWLGWQGIIPSKAAKMAGIFVDKTMSRLGTLRELFARMEPARIAEHVVTIVGPRLDAYTDEVMFYAHGTLWRTLPEAAKRQVYREVRERFPARVRGLVGELGERVEELVDFKEMLVRLLVHDKVLLNRLFLESGTAEFRFLVRSGLHFGFLFGLVQLAVWVVLPAWWVLPLFGGIVGWVTNWIALNLIFRPLEPRRIGPFTLQGLFLRRQTEVAAVWCRLVTTEIVTVQRIIYAMLDGPRAAETREVVRRHLQPIADEVLAGFQPLAGIAVDESALAEIRRRIGDKAVSVSTDPFDHWPFNRERAEVIERWLRERMEALPPAEFQDLLRPCFQEDEMKLIVTGGVLGLIAGVVQIVFVF